MPKTLLIICGPTAAGKTKVAVHLAQLLPTEIVSADSRQFYREIPIGTAAPGYDELTQVPHHLVGQLSINDPYSAASFRDDALNALEMIFRHNDTAILCGGSGMFIDAVVYGFDDIPDVEPGIRQKLNEDYHRHGIRHLQQMLATLDPDYYTQVDLNNPQRIIRALEVTISTDTPYSTFRKGRKENLPYKIAWIGISPSREQLAMNIDQRVDHMIGNGFIDEAARVHPLKGVNALETVGYKELFAYFENQISLEEAIMLIKRNTRRYAKRQLTWFRRNENIRWFQPEQLKEIESYVAEQVNAGAD